MSSHLGCDCLYNIMGWYVALLALLTADGTDDDLIKLEGVPKGEKFTF